MSSQSGNVVTCTGNFFLRHSSVVYEDMKVLQKHLILAIIFCLLLCDVRIGLTFKYFVICDTPVLGDAFIFGNSQKNPRNLQEGLKL
jgi:hypothetical protein